VIVAATGRLTLRELNLEDAAFILELLNEPAFLRFIGDKGVRNLHDAREYLLQGPIGSYARDGYGLYAVCLHDGTRLGICGLVKRDGLSDPDVGFAFLARHRAQGYAVESAAAVLRRARDVLQLRRILAICSPDNAASMAVLEKIGLRFAGMIRLPENDSDLKLFAL
jgi:[ribosomal protein S5]-alanine N-acetyltransferase